MGREAGGGGGRGERGEGGGERQGREDSQLQCSLLLQCNKVIFAIVFSSAQREEEENEKREQE